LPPFFTLPEGVPFEAVVYEIGREFLGATPRNTKPVLGGSGAYMRGRVSGVTTESVSFFVDENVFVYVFGASLQAPTEQVAREIHEASESGQ
jgi:hypothetical protein